MVESARSDGGWQPRLQRKRNAARRGQSPPGESLPPLRVRHVDAAEASGRPIRHWVACLCASTLSLNRTKFGGLSWSMPFPRIAGTVQIAVAGIRCPNLRNMIDVDASISQIAKAPTLRRMPLVVLTKTKPFARVCIRGGGTLLARSRPRLGQTRTRYPSHLRHRQ